MAVVSVLFLHNTPTIEIAFVLRHSLLKIAFKRKTELPIHKSRSFLYFVNSVGVLFSFQPGSYGVLLSAAWRRK